MEKLVYLLWKSPEATAAGVRDALLGAAGKKILERSSGNVTILTADIADHLHSPHEPEMAATVSFWLDSVDDRGAIEEVLSEIAPSFAGYLVTESVPRDYASRNWADGEKSPGVTMIALIRRPERLTYEQFLTHWHGSHTPKSLEVHPLTRYIRNVVARPLTPDAPVYHGIVPEGLESVEHFFNPRLLYGSKENEKMMIADMTAFLDVQEVHWTMVNEYILRT